MRLAYAVFCSRVENQEKGRMDLLEVATSLDLEIRWQGPEGAPPPPRVPLNTVLAASLIDGAPGQHRFEVSIRMPRGDRKTVGTFAQFDWPEGVPIHLLTVNLEMQIEPRDGTWEFLLAVDGRHVGTVPLIITFDIERDPAG